MLKMEMLELEIRHMIGELVTNDFNVDSEKMLASIWVLQLAMLVLTVLLVRHRGLLINA